MGLVVRLEDSRGTQISVVFDEKNVLAKLLPGPEWADRYPHLCAIDLYGDTVFNALQAPRLRREWEWMEQRATDDQKQVLTDVAELMDRVRSEDCVYLKFVGD